MSKHIIAPENYLAYMLSGKPEFTLTNTRSGNEAIFRVHASKHGLAWWVNDRMFTRLGSIYPVGADGYALQLRTPQELNPFQLKDQEIFNWFWIRMFQYRVPDFIEMSYPGVCGHCKRELTHPDSLPIGIGPDCLKKLPARIISPSKQAV